MGVVHSDNQVGFSLSEARVATGNVKVKCEVHGSVNLKCIPKYGQQDAALHRFFYFCKLLCMFRVNPSPIIRSTTLYLQHLVFVKLLLLPAAIVDELFHDSGR